MSERLKRIMKDGTERNYGIVIDTVKVAHVTFYIVKDEVKEDCYHVYSESEKQGFNLVSDSFEYQQHDSGSHDDALAILRMEIQNLEETLERKRSGIPTPKQVYFLFREKIPIPPDLTWGQASDLIDDKLAQIARDKQTERIERFNGFTEGDRVSFTWGEFNEETGYSRVTKTGHITKLYRTGKRKYALVESDSRHPTSYRLSDDKYGAFDTLHKIVEEATA